MSIQLPKQGIGREALFEEIRKRTQAPLHTVIYTHGHLDHAFGLAPWLEAGERHFNIERGGVIRR